MARFVAWEELSGLLRPHGANHAGPPYLGLEDAHEDVAHLVDNKAVPGLPLLRLDSCDGVLGGQRVRAVNEGVDAFGVGVEDHAGVAVHCGVVGPGAGGQAEAAHELVLLQRAIADGLGPAPAAAKPVVLHVPEAVLGSDEALGEESVSLAFGADVGYAQVVAVDLDLAGQPLEPQRSRKPGDCRRQLGAADFGYALRLAYANHATHLAHRSAERGLLPGLDYSAGYAPAGIGMLSHVGVGIFMDYYGRAIGVKYRMLLVSL